MTKQADTETVALRASLHEMLSIYWEAGDGETPPEFIQRAAKLAGFALNDLPTEQPVSFSDRHIPIFLRGDEWVALLAVATQRALAPPGVAIYHRATAKLATLLKGEAKRGQADMQAMGNNMLVPV